METKNIEDLKANPQNPRTMSVNDAKALKKSMTEFGDLSSIVFNTQTGQLVGGHQRVNILKSIDGQKNIQITQRFEPANEDGTTAIGYVTINGKAFPYREVSWRLERELAANLAANKIQGDFDNDLLGEVIYQIQQEESALLDLIGFDQKEIDKLLKQSGAVEDEPSQEIDEEPKLVFKITDSQKDVIEQTIRNAKINNQLTGDDETVNGKALIIFIQEYLINHPNTDDQFTPPELPQQ